MNPKTLFENLGYVVFSECLSESECKELVKYAFSLNEITNFHLRILENQKLNDELIEYSRN